VTCLHAGERKHCCTTCGKLFLKSDHLKRHERTHTSERPFTCEKCGKGFRDKDHLKVRACVKIAFFLQKTAEGRNISLGPRSYTRLCCSTSKPICVFVFELQYQWRSSDRCAKRVLTIKNVVDRMWFWRQSWYASASLQSRKVFSSLALEVTTDPLFEVQREFGLFVHQRLSVVWDFRTLH